MRSTGRVAYGVLIAVAAVIGRRWYVDVALATSFYDEVGITLNGYMPKPIREWGCEKIRSRFPGTIPPYGCPVTQC